jgi:hypothetical protein
MPSITRNITPQNELHKKICKRLEHRVKMAESVQRNQHEEWRQADDAMMAYVPTSEADKRRDNRRESGEPQYTTVVIPYRYAVAMASHTYWTSVFYARNPVHQYMGRHGEGQQQVQAVEAIIDYQFQNGGHLVPHYGWMFDMGKYGFGVLGTHWEKEERHVVSLYTAGDVPPEELQAAGVINSETIDGIDPDQKLEKVEKLTTYEGNKVYNVNPYDWLPDPRVPMQQFQKGEFCALRRSLGWNQIKYKEAQGYYMNVDRIKSASGTKTERTLNQGNGLLPEDQRFFDEEGLDHPSMVHLYEVYVEIIPSEWGVSKRDFPEKWVFTVTQDMSLLIGAVPLGAYHCRFPFDIIEMEPDAYSLYSRGIPKILKPIEDTMNWLLNAHFFNVRAALQNLFIVDPSRVNIRDIEDPLPGGIIRIRDTALGTNVKDAIHQVQINDFTRQHLADLQVMQGIGERIIGVNDQMLGAQLGSGRKTATEVRTSTSFGVNRQKTIVEFASAMGMQPHAKMLVQNTQQYYDTEQKFRIAGSLAAEGQGFINVGPGSIEGFYDLSPVDGALPIDRMAQVKLWQELLMQARTIPDIALRYDFGRIFEFVSGLAGIKNMGQFKVEVMPDEQVMQAIKAGNLIGPQGGGGGAGERTPPLGNNASGAGGPTL